MDPLRSGLTVDMLCAEAEMSEEALEQLQAVEDSRHFVARLVEMELYGDALTFLAHALPRREAVWWSWLCARDAAGPEPKPAVGTSLEATKVWIAEPSDANRRAAMNAGETAGLDSAVGLSALAAFLCGDSLGPSSAPPAPPGPFAAAKAITGAIHLAACAKPEDLAGRYTEFVKRGVELADRIKLWTPEAAGAAKGERQ
jgi:hypothetical protein